MQKIKKPLWTSHKLMMRKDTTTTAMQAGKILVRIFISKCVPVFEAKSFISLYFLTTFKLQKDENGNLFEE